ncbi:TPA: hypothetical protein DEG75_04105 [Candidatus Dependentiae bacterium]|nr:hypothetical protein [Candidatus Dependentiae bacterium]
MLLNAALTGDLATIKDLVKTKKVSVNSQCPKTGNTALHYACQKEDKETIRYLLACKAKFDIPNKKSETALYYVKKYNCSQSITRLFTDKGANFQKIVPPSSSIKTTISKKITPVKKIKKFIAPVIEEEEIDLLFSAINLRQWPHALDLIQKNYQSKQSTKKLLSAALEQAALLEKQNDSRQSFPLIRMLIQKKFKNITISSFFYDKNEAMLIKAITPFDKTPQETCSSFGAYLPALCDEHRCPQHVFNIPESTWKKRYTKPAEDIWALTNWLPIPFKTLSSDSIEEQSQQKCKQKLLYNQRIWEDPYLRATQALFYFKKLQNLAKKSGYHEDKGNFTFPSNTLLKRKQCDLAIFFKNDSPLETLYKTNEEECTVEKYMDAAREENLQEIKRCIKNGIPIDSKDDNYEKNGALHIACKNKNETIIRYLLKKKANPTIQAELGVQPLYYACKYCSPSIFNLFLQKGVTKPGLWCLSRAVSGNNIDLVHYLFNHTFIDKKELRNKQTIESLYNDAANCFALECIQYLVEKQNMTSQDPICIDYALLAAIHTIGCSNHKNDKRAQASRFIFYLITTKGAFITKNQAILCEAAECRNLVDFCKYLIDQGGINYYSFGGHPLTTMLNHPNYCYRNETPLSRALIRYLIQKDPTIKTSKYGIKRSLKNYSGSLTSEILLPALIPFTKKVLKENPVKDTLKEWKELSKLKPSAPFLHALKNEYSTPVFSVLDKEVQKLLKKQCIKMPEEIWALMNWLPHRLTLSPLDSPAKQLQQKCEQELLWNQSIWEDEGIRATQAFYYFKNLQTLAKKAVNKQTKNSKNDLVIYFG